MRSPSPSRLACLALGLLVTLPSFARVGEPQEDFERRLFQPSVGKFFKDRNADPLKEDEFVRQMPITPFRTFFPLGLRERKYWKSAVPGMLSSENGWRVHVFFQDNRSVLEAYFRMGDTLNEYEVRNILASNQGASEWKKVEQDSLESRASAIGCDYQLANGNLRAKVTGNWIIVYTAELDNHVKEQVRLAEENKTMKQEDRVRLQQLNASGSTSGF